MSLAWLYPAGFAALAALLLPLLIHLARRDQQAPLDFAALRWLRNDPRPRRRLRFDERLLLVLRLLLLALLALWLARPVLLGAEDRRPYVAVMPGVAATAVSRLTLPVDARLHWLAAGFPALDTPNPGDRQPISSLLRELDAQLPPQTPLIVLAAPRFDGTDAQRPRLSRPLQWHVIDASGVAMRAVENAQPRAPAAPRLVLPTDAGHAAGLRYLRAAQRAWQAGDTAPAVQVRLQDGPLPPELRRQVEAGGTALLGADVVVPAGIALSPLWRDTAGQPLVEGGALGDGRLLRFTRALQPQAMPELLEADFPQRLRELLQPAAAEPARVDARAYAPRTGGRAVPPPPHELQPWLALLIALLFALERMLATRATRGALG